MTVQIANSHLICFGGIYYQIDWHRTADGILATWRCPACSIRASLTAVNPNEAYDLAMAAAQAHHYRQHESLVGPC